MKAGTGLAPARRLRLCSTLKPCLTGKSGGWQRVGAEGSTLQFSEVERLVGLHPTHQRHHFNPRKIRLTHGFYTDPLRGSGAIIGVFCTVMGRVHDFGLIFALLWCVSKFLI